MDKKELQECRAGLETYLGDLLEPVGRNERRHWGAFYVRGLLLDGEHKSIEPIANRMPDANVQAMQQFTGQSPWNHMPIRRRLTQRMARELVPFHAWIIDDTGFPKKGGATDDACMPLDFALYLPESWASDPQRMKRAGVPEGTVSKTKWQVALDLVDEVLLWDVPRGVIVSDIFYGKINEFGQGLIDRELSYVVEVESKIVIFDQPDSAERKKEGPRKNMAKKKPKTLSVEDFAETLPSWRFKTIRWREGSKGHMVSRFAAVRVQPAHGHSKR